MVCVSSLEFKDATKQTLIPPHLVAAVGSASLPLSDREQIARLQTEFYFKIILYFICSVFVVFHIELFLLYLSVFFCFPVQGLQCFEYLIITLGEHG